MGRKSGKLYSTPIYLLEIDGRWNPGGSGVEQTQWVRNAEAAGEVTLKKGSFNRTFRLRAIPDSDKPPYLKTYLDSFKTTVQRYFTVPAGSDMSRHLPVSPPTIRCSNWWPSRNDRSMTLDQFRDSLKGEGPPADLDFALKGLWWDAKGDWNRAHESAQQDEGPRGAWVHAYLHRKEGDASNAAYWDEPRRPGRRERPARRRVARDIPAPLPS